MRYTPPNPQTRAIQLDGLRALAMLGICWDHWVPSAWNFNLPYEVGLYFFFVLTGYFITGSLLRTRDRLENSSAGQPWRWQAWKHFQWRRGLRIIAPYYIALGIAFLFLAPKLHQDIHWYLLYLTNIHIAIIGHWPHGTSHFWSIAIQQQFYLLSPLIIWLVPKRTLPLALILFTCLAPISRYLDHHLIPPFTWPAKITWASSDFFGIGGLMALATHRGLPLSSPIWKILAVLCGSTFLYLEFAPRFGLPPTSLGPFGPFYATLLSLALCGIIATATLGYKGPLGKLLENPTLQKIGLLSYGIYLYHNLSPIILGKTLPFLWAGPYADSLPQAALRTLCFAALTAAMTLASWKYIETPLNNIRAAKP